MATRSRSFSSKSAAATGNRVRRFSARPLSHIKGQFLVKAMQRVVQILTVIVALFAFTHRLPAPIQETDPTPTHVQKVKQRSNNVKKTEAKPSTPAPKPRATLA